ncbi:uncharacterized protein LOC111888946 [Lactuca sativa]|uniref:uncharacterized protein LOC111888946 n=1 Tax=Lactuca sativa TaxID=4236 RepID=UPI001C68CD19|nr:uncharacterized protein LOC111888946 [Lactuca sativa]
MASEDMITLKLLVHKGTQKVLYAEAPKEFVDFLLHLFSLPLGTINQLLGSKHMVGGLGKLKESVESLNPIYFQPGINKDNIFSSKTAFNGNMFLLLDDVSANERLPVTSTKKVYTCSYFGISRNGYQHQYCLSTTENPATLCPTCSRSMNVPLNLIGTPVVNLKEADQEKPKAGFVKEVVTYMVMDDLVVKPMSTISSITLINSFAVKDLSQLEEKTLPFGKDEALKLLRASLSTNEVLTTLYQKTNDA